MFAFEGTPYTFAGVGAPVRSRIYSRDDMAPIFVVTRVCHQDVRPETF